MKIAILGYGTVGSGVVEILQKNKQSIAKKASQEIDIKYILDIRDFDDEIVAGKIVKDFNIILNDNEVKIVVEAMGGINPAFNFAKASMEKGKCFVTSNKELVAQKGAQLLEIAIKNNVTFLFEASVGGGIPIIRPLHQCLAANEIFEIVGILNGTTNYILTKMSKQGMNFNETLLKAQELGYAEKDPTDDIEGNDSCRKICILGSLAFGRHIYPNSVYTQGISNITIDDIKTAANFNSTIKLLGKVKKLEDGNISIIVAPFVIPLEHPLANVEDVFNGILIKGDAIGDVVFYGRGAGKLPTASAMIADIIDCAKNFGPQKRLLWNDVENNDFIQSKDKQQTSFMIRIKTNNATKAIKNIKNLFANVELISTIGTSEYAFITPIDKEEKLLDLIEKLKLKQHIKNIISVIRVEQ